jgi:NAD-dependent dihydropyrimidine dehydrogenase PreA subunit
LWKQRVAGNFTGGIGKIANPEEVVLMAYVINDPCIATKDTSCVEVCPVDCIHPTPDEPGFAEAEQLFIDPAECIDCDACVEACPVDAITSEDQLPPEWKHNAAKNAAYYVDVPG